MKQKSLIKPLILIVIFALFLVAFTFNALGLESIMGKVLSPLEIGDVDNDVEVAHALNTNCGAAYKYGYGTSASTYLTYTLTDVGTTDTQSLGGDIPDNWANHKNEQELVYIRMKINYSDKMLYLAQNGKLTFNIQGRAWSYSGGNNIQSQQMICRAWDSSGNTKYHDTTGTTVTGKQEGTPASVSWTPSGSQVIYFIEIYWSIKGNNAITLDSPTITVSSSYSDTTDPTITLNNPITNFSNTTLTTSSSVALADVGSRLKSSSLSFVPQGSTSETVSNKPATYSSTSATLNLNNGYGKYTIVLTDLFGNSTTKTFYYITNYTPQSGSTVVDMEEYLDADNFNGSGVYNVPLKITDTSVLGKIVDNGIYMYNTMSFTESAWTFGPVCPSTSGSGHAVVYYDIDLGDYVASLLNNGVEIEVYFTGTSGGAQSHVVGILSKSTNFTTTDARYLYRIGRWETQYDGSTTNNGYNSSWGGNNGDARIESGVTAHYGAQGVNMVYGENIQTRKTVNLAGRYMRIILGAYSGGAFSNVTISNPSLQLRIADTIAPSVTYTAVDGYPEWTTSPSVTINETIANGAIRSYSYTPTAFDGTQSSAVSATYQVGNTWNTSIPITLPYMGNYQVSVTDFLGNTSVTNINYWAPTLNVTIATDGDSTSKNGGSIATSTLDATNTYGTADLSVDYKIGEVMAFSAKPNTGYYYAGITTSNQIYSSSYNRSITSVYAGTIGGYSGYHKKSDLEFLYAIYLYGAPSLNVGDGNINIVVHFTTIGETPSASGTITYDNTNYPLNFGSSYSGKAGETFQAVAVYEKIVDANRESVTEVKNAGSYEYYGKVTSEDATILLGNTSTYSLTIDKRVVSFTAKNYNLTYGETIPDLEYTTTGTIASGDEDLIGVTISRSSTSKNVGEYDITISYTENDNYTLSKTDGTMVITQAPLTVTVSAPASSVYGTVVTPSISYSGFVYSETSSSLTTQASVNLSTITNAKGFINADSDSYKLEDYLTKATSSNYNITHNAGAFSITPRKLSLVYTSESKSYDGAVPSASNSQVTITNFADGENLSYLVSSEGFAFTLIIENVTKDAGIYTVSASSISTLTNYTTSFTGGTYTINKVTLSATYVSEEITYGSFPVGRVAYSGFVNGENASVLTTAPTVDFTTITTVTVIGENTYINAKDVAYSLAPSGGSAINYDFDYKNGTLKVHQRTLNITLKEQSSVYGDEIVVDSTKYSTSLGTVLAGDDLGVTITRDSTDTSVGTYSLSYAWANTNYSLSGSNGTYTITKAILTVTYLGERIVYGSGPMEGNISYSGFKYDDTVATALTQSCSMDFTTLNYTGSYVTANESGYLLAPIGGSATNYSFEYVSDLLVVQKAPLSITYMEEITYGDAPATSSSASEFTINGLLSGDRLSDLTINANLPINVGDYVITSDNISLSATNYTASSVNGTLKISPASLEITVNAPVGLSYGDEVSLDVIYGTSGKGFKNGDTEDDLTTKVSIDLSSITNEKGYVNANVLGYDLSSLITEAYSPNYDIEHQTGKLYLTKRTLSFTYAGESRVYNASLPNPSKDMVSVSGFVAGEDLAYLNESEGFDFVLNVNSPNAKVGTYLVYESYTYGAGRSELTNYTCTFTRNNFIITKALLLATYVGEEITYGDSPVGAISYTGFQGEDNESALTTSSVVDFSTITDVTTIGENTYINVGEGYALTPQGGSAVNYDISYASGTLKVTKRAVTITIKNQTSVYGAEIVVNQGADCYTVSGLIEGDSLESVTISKEGGVTVGNHILSATATSRNYEATYIEGTYTITKATLHVSIDFIPASIEDIGVVDIDYDDFIITYTGFVYSEDDSLLDMPVSVDVDATKLAISQLGNIPGTYDIIYYLGEDDQYDFVYDFVDTIVVVASLKDVDISGLSFEDLTTTYNGEEQFIYITWENKPEDVEVTVTYTYSSASHYKVGTYSVRATFNVVTPGYKNEIPTMNAVLVIVPIELEITLANQTSVYGEPIVVDQTKYSVSGTILEGDDLGLSIIKSDTMNANHGEYTLSATWTNTNYNLTIIDALYVITNRNVTISLLDQVGEYSTSAIIDQSAYTITSGSLVEDSHLQLTISVEDAPLYEVGEEYIISAVVVDNEWYNFTLNTAIYTVNPKNIQITLDDVSNEYGSTPISDTTYSITAGELVNALDDLGLTFSLTSAEKYVVGGTYVISATASNKNYIVDVQNAEYIIVPKALKIIVSNQSSTYGEVYLIQNLFELADGYALVLDDTLDDLGVKVSVENGSINAGNYSLSASATNSNYDIEIVKGNYEIKKATTYLYTDKLQTTYTYSGYAVNFRTANSYVYSNREDPTANIKIPSDNVVNAGTYNVVFSINESTNYLSATIDVTITVNKALPSVSLQALLSNTYVYNGAEQHIYADKEDIIAKADMDEVVLSWTNNTFTNVPANGRQIVEVTLSETTNYISSTFTQEVHIYKAKYDFTGLGYAFDSKSLSYDGNEHYIEVVNLPSGITVTYSYNGETSATPLSFKDAGVYIIEAIYSYDEVNYEIPTEFINSSYVKIDRINITVEVVDQHGYYGDDPVFDDSGVNIIAGNFIEGDHINLELELEPKDSYPVGVYRLVANTTSTGNYNVTVASGSYTIVPRPITVTIDSKEGQYGDDDPVFTYKITAGEMIGEDTLTTALVRAEGKTPGEYQISGSAINPNYQVSVVNGIYTIVPRQITIEVFNQSGTSASQVNKRAYKTFGKILRGDNLNIQVVGEIGSEPGDYVLTATYNENPNYAVTIKNGVFTMRKVTIITVSNPITKKLYDGNPYVFDVSVSSGATPIFSVDGIFVENSFTEVGIYNLSINAEVEGEYASPEPYRLTFEIRPTELIAEVDGVIIKVSKEGGFGAEERLDVKYDPSATLSGDNFTSKVDTAYNIFIIKDQESVPLSEYAQGEEVHIKVKPNAQLTEVGAETWFVDGNNNLLQGEVVSDEEGFVELVVSDGGQVLFVTSRDEATPILVTACGMAVIFLIMGMFFLFRKKFIN